MALIAVQMPVCVQGLGFRLLTRGAVRQTAANYDKEQGCKWDLAAMKLFMMSKHGPANGTSWDEITGAQVRLDMRGADVGHSCTDVGYSCTRGDQRDDVRHGAHHHPLPTVRTKGQYQLLLGVGLQYWFPTVRTKIQYQQASASSGYR
eukprot:429638-Rhodomonas_salina.1